MRCLVTGASGFIGSHLVNTLVDQGFQVAIIARPSSDLWRIREVISKITVISGDLAYVAGLEPLLKEFQPQVVVHSGWHGVQKTHRNDEDQINSNLTGSLNFLRLCLDSGCKTWIGFGSQAEYGPTNATLFEQETPAHPDTVYGAVKLSLGLISQLLCAQAGIQFAWLRLTAAFGPKDDDTHLIPYVIHTLLQGEKPRLSTGEQKWDYLYINDVIQAVLMIMEHPQAEGFFNLSSGRAVAVRKICEMIRDEINPDLSLGLGEIPTGPAQRTLLEANNQRLCALTGWQPQTPLEWGIKQTVAWYRQQVASEGSKRLSGEL